MHPNPLVATSSKIDTPRTGREDAAPDAPSAYEGWRAYLANRTPEQVCIDAINAAIWHAAWLAAGRPSIESDHEGWAVWLKDSANSREAHRQSLRFAHAARVSMVGWIANARHAGVTDREILDLGIVPE